MPLRILQPSQLCDRGRMLELLEAGEMHYPAGLDEQLLLHRMLHQLRNYTVHNLDLLRKYTTRCQSYVGTNCVVRLDGQHHTKSRHRSDLSCL